MITVVPIQQKEEQAHYCALCGVPYSPDLLAYYAKNDAGEFAGLCQFKMNETGGHLYTLVAPKGSEELDPLFVMGRAALNFIDLCGVHHAFFDGDPTVAGEKLIRAIGFTPDENGRLEMDLTDFFTTPCKHCKH